MNTKNKRIILSVILLIVIAGAGFLIFKKYYSPVNNGWEGNWIRENSNNFISGKLNIKDITNSSFLFNLFANYGGNVGSIGEDPNKKEFARIEGNTATDIITDNDLAIQCNLLFRLEGESIYIEPSEGCSSYAGFNVTFNGKYKKNGKIKETTLKDLAVLDEKSKEIFVFKDSTEISAFTKLVGQKYIGLFTGSFMLTNNLETDEALNAKIYSGSVFGTLMRAIIVKDASGKTWAAATDYEGENSVIRYFTNVAAYKDRLPDSIEKWKVGTYTEEVIFMNKN